MKLPYIILQQNNNSPEAFTFSVKVENGIGITLRKWLKGNIDLFKEYDIDVDFNELGFLEEPDNTTSAEKNNRSLKESAYKIKKRLYNLKKEREKKKNIRKSKK